VNEADGAIISHALSPLFFRHKDNFCLIC
jgi:hypothetical protein